MVRLTHKEKEWAYEKWCEGYTQQQVADALHIGTSTLNDHVLRGRPRIRPILTYNEADMDEVVVIKDGEYIIYNGVIYAKAGTKQKRVVTKILERKK